MSSTSSSRRRGVALAAAALLGGCGFRPLNAPYGGTREAALPTGVTAADLAGVRVALIPERDGQLLRRALQRRFEESRPGTPATHELRVALQLGLEPQGFRRDGTPTRVRGNLLAPWTLLATPATAAAPGAPAPAPTAVATGTARAFDAHNVPDNEFFAAEVSGDAMRRRLVDAVAEDIVAQIAVTLATARAGAG